MLSEVGKRTLTDGLPSVSVIVCAYTMQRWGILCEGIDSIVNQTEPAHEVFLVVDHNPELLERAKGAFSAIRVVANERERGSSESKNTAVELADSEILAFLDDDAVADERWLAELLGPYRDPGVIGTCGVPIPRWMAGEAPAWLPPEFYWTIGCGYRGLPEESAPVRNPIGASMSFRKSVFDRIGGFSSYLGPNMATPSPHGGGEETEFGIRAQRAYPSGALIHVPAARVDHQVPAERTTFSYFRRRCWLEGRAKALLSAQVGALDGLSSERAYVCRTLPTGVMIGIRDSLGGDRDAFRRSLAIAVGLAVTTAGYLWGRLEGALGDAGEPQAEEEKQ